MSIPSWAVPGAKVVCVDDRPQLGTNWTASEKPAAGQIYTIVRAFLKESDDSPTLRLREIQRCPRSKQEWGEDVGYHVWRFRPLVEPEIERELYHKAGLKPKAPHSCE